MESKRLHPIPLSILTMSIAGTTFPEMSDQPHKLRSILLSSLVSSLKLKFFLDVGSSTVQKSFNVLFIFYQNCASQVLNFIHKSVCGLVCTCVGGDKCIR